MREEKLKNGFYLKLVAEPYRYCLFPFSEINAMNYCDNTFKKISDSRALICKNMMCINCCNHLLYTAKEIVDKSMVSTTLELNDDRGFNKMKGVFTMDMINKCRQDCKTEYPAVVPDFKAPPKKDPLLGVNEQNYAQSCIDIKINGIDAKSGLYWVKPDTKKPAFKVYCDMENDNGGWTLFYGYSHSAKQTYEINSNTLPQDPKTAKSHSNLKVIGF